jgi:phosphomannomutase
MFAFLPPLALPATDKTYGCTRARAPLSFEGVLCAPTCFRLHVLSHPRLRRAGITACASSQPPSAAAASTTAAAVGASLRDLQNGSDIRGVALALGAAPRPVTLTTGHMREIVAAFARFAGRRLDRSTVKNGLNAPPLRLAIGRDSRLSGPELAHAAAIGALSEGAEVTDFGLATTPAMFMATVLDGYQYDCAIMLTASHLPSERNGAKFFTKYGSTDKKEVRAILDDAAAAVGARDGVFLSEDAAGPDPAARVIHFDYLPVYSAHLRALICKGCAHPENYDDPLTGFKIVVDAGNGAAGFFAEQVLKPLGAEVFGQFLEPDGTFPNHVPNPEDKKAMQMTIDATLANKADLGIIFDTDVDRSGVVDSAGTGINRNRLIALLARIVLREHPGSTIVTDSVTSNGLKNFIERYGGHHFRYRKGYKNVIDKGIELNEAGRDTQLAIETSGHGAMKENYMLDDGAYLAVKIIIEMVRLRLEGDETGIGGLLADLETPVEEREFRLDFLDQTDYQSYGAKVVESFAEFASGIEGWTVEETNYEGYRVVVDEGGGKAGWLLLRQSLHDPLLPLNVESEIPGGIANIVSILAEGFLPMCSNLDAASIHDYIEQSRTSSERTM